MCSIFFRILIIDFYKLIQMISFLNNSKQQICNIKNFLKIVLIQFN